MPRAPSRCSPICPKPIFKYGRCKDHQPVKEAWKDSTRSSSFLKSAEWQRQRRRIIFREKGFCQLCNAPDSRHVDHVIPVWYTKREQVTDDELQLLCETCHGKKSSFEGVQARRIKAAKRIADSSQED